MYKWETMRSQLEKEVRKEFPKLKGEPKSEYKDFIVGEVDIRMKELLPFVDRKIPNYRPAKKKDFIYEEAWLKGLLFEKE